MPDVVSLTAVDDEVLYRATEALGNLAEKLEAGETIEDIPSVLRFVAASIALVMAEAYERAMNKPEFGFN